MTNVNRKSTHVIQSGPYKGKTIAEKRRIKRSQTSGTTNQPMLQVRRGGSRRGRPRGPLQVLRPRSANNAAQILETLVQDMAGASLKPKDAVNFFNQIPGLTRAGRLYLLALTHPNNEELRSFAGIPDSMPDEFNPYVSIDDAYVITWDTTLFAAAIPEGVSVYNIHAFFPPIPEIECVYYLSYTHTGAVFRSRVAVVRAPGFRTQTNTTISAGNVLKSFATMRDVGYSTHRCAGSGRTLIAICSDLNNQGNVVAGQLPDLITWSDVEGELTGPASLVGGTASNIGADIAPTEEMQVFKHATLTLPKEDVLTQLDKKCMDGQYRDGVYLPIVPANPVDTLKKRDTIYSGSVWAPITRSTDGTAIANKTFACSNSFLTVNQTSSTNILADMEFAQSSSFLQQVTSPMDIYTPVIEGGVSGTILGPTYLHPSVSEPADMLTGFAYFSGLSIQGSGIVSTASVKIRYTSYHELYPINTAPDVAVYRMGHPLRDQEALNIAAHIVQVMAHALPAGDNAFNGILGKIWNVIMKWVKPVAQVASVLPIPYAGPIGTAVSGGIDAIDTIANAGMI